MPKSSHLGQWTWNIAVDGFVKQLYGLMLEETECVPMKGADAKTQIPKGKEVALLGLVACTKPDHGSRIENEGSSTYQQIPFFTEKCEAAPANLLSGIHRIEVVKDGLNRKTMLEWAWRYTCYQRSASQSYSMQSLQK